MEVVGDTKGKDDRFREISLLQHKTLLTYQLLGADETTALDRAVSAILL
jgi:hypothetical protein